MVDRPTVGARHKRLASPALNGVRYNHSDKLLLQVEQCGRGCHRDADESEVLVRQVVITRGLKLKFDRIGFGNHFGHSGLNLFECVATDKTLQHRDVRCVNRIKREACGIVFVQARIRRLCLGDHRCIGIEQNINGRRREFRISGLNGCSRSRPEEQKDAKPIKRMNQFFHV